MALPNTRDITLAPGTQLAAVSVEQDVTAGESGVSVLSATTCEVRTYNSAGAGSAQAHYAWFYQA